MHFSLICKKINMCCVCHMIDIEPRMLKFSTDKELRNKGNMCVYRSIHTGKKFKTKSLIRVGGLGEGSNILNKSERC